MKTKLQLNSKRKRLAGFTLMEMAIVLIVIGVISAIAIVAIRATTDSTRTEKTRAVLTQINTAQIGAALANDWSSAADIDESQIILKLQGLTPNVDTDVKSVYGTIVWGSKVGWDTVHAQPSPPYVVKPDGTYIFPDPTQTAP